MFILIIYYKIHPGNRNQYQYRIEGEEAEGMFSRFFRLILLTVFALSGLVSEAITAGSYLPIQTAPHRPANTFTVDDNQDNPDSNPGDGLCDSGNGKCTLRAAIMEANANSDADTIILPADTYLIGTELAVTNPVAVNGAGEASTIIDGQSSTRVFRFAFNSGPHALSGLTIQNGSNQNLAGVERNGGGIYTQASLSLANVTIQNSQAYQGGGIYNEYYAAGSGTSPHTLNLTNVTLSGNAATGGDAASGGGGLFNGSNLVADGLWITNNSSSVQGGGILINADPQYNLSISITHFNISGNTAKDGAGIDTDLGTVTLSNGKITGNVSSCCRPTGGDSTGGGGIYNNFGRMTLTNVSISQNQATAPQGFAGGIYNSDYMTLNNVTMTGNFARLGAAIFNGNFQNRPNQLDITNATLVNNVDPAAASSTSEGGAIFNVQAGRVSLVNATITQNSAHAGGGIFNNDAAGSIELVNTILTGNTDKSKIPDCGGPGPITSLGNNLLGKVTCSLTPQASDQVGADPLFGPAGSFTVAPTISLFYLPLSLSSPAVDQGSNAKCPSTDEINTPRPYNQTCDIGAIEYNGLPDVKYNYIYLAIIQN
jgi:hypothetical protein